MLGLAPGPADNWLNGVTAVACLAIGLLAPRSGREEKK